MTDSTSTTYGADERAMPLFRRGAWGRLALVLLPLVAVSGMVLAFVYRADPAQAWWSVAAVAGGDLAVVRDLHRWGGEMLVLAAWLHVFRVFMVGAYRHLPGWGVSLGGTVLIVCLAATGWCLRHDSAAARALDVLGLFGGGLPVVFALHVLVLPVLLGLLAVPWWRRPGGSSRGGPAPDDGATGGHGEEPADGGSTGAGS